ncbi:MAG: DJ-1/PfpI family protein [Myxococcales bacterium]|nr:DJ-1/PfpI family protein [Myxococcales bacterium]
MGVKIAFVIYDGMTTLDFIGVYDPVTRLRTMGFVPDLTWDVCGPSDEILDGSGLRILPRSVYPILGAYTMVVVPGGPSAREFVGDEGFIEWLRTALPCKLKASVCTGSLLLGAAGFLHHKRAATHPSARGLLAPYCAEVSEERIVDDGDVITAGGVSSSIDLGLYLCEKLADADARRRIAKQMDYPYGP